MNTLYKKIVAIILVISSSVVIAKNNNMTSNDKKIALQFAPIAAAPFSQEKDDQYFAELLSKIIQINEENYNNPHLKKIESMTDLIAKNLTNLIVVSKKASFGWNDPLAIVSALFYNGAAETPNDLIVKIEVCTEYPERYKATLKGRGLYSNNKTAHSELTDYIKTGPTHVSKYAKLEDITTLQKLYDPKTNSFKKSEKDQLQKYTPSIQGEVTCNCYFHGCDLNGIIYFDEQTLAYLIQQRNGNRHLQNTVQKKSSENNITNDKTAVENINESNDLESIIKSIKAKYPLSSQDQQSKIQTLEEEEEEEENKKLAQVKLPSAVDQDDKK